MGSVVVPIQQHEIVEFLFEISEKIPNSIYLDTMNLMKKYHDSEISLPEVQYYLERNKSIIEKGIFEKLIHLLQPPREPFFKCSCECSHSYYCLLVIAKFIIIPVVLFGFIGVLVFCFITKK